MPTNKGEVGVAIGNNIITHDQAKRMFKDNPRMMKHYERAHSIATKIMEGLGDVDMIGEKPKAKSKAVKSFEK